MDQPLYDPNDELAQLQPVEMMGMEEPMGGEFTPTPMLHIDDDAGTEINDEFAMELDME